jgi:cobaltochelatase CobN
MKRVVIALCFLLAWPVVSHAVPRIAIVSVELAQQPNLMAAAATKVADRIQVDLFGLGGGLLPTAEGVDLGAYDLVVVEGVGAKLVDFRAAIAQAKARTTVIVVNGESWVQGNVALKDHPWIPLYWANATVENDSQLLLYLGRQFLHLADQPRAPVVYPNLAFYHPDAGKPFASLPEYLAWAEQRLPDARTRPRIGLIFYRSLVLADNAAVVDDLIHEIEKRGGLPVPLWRKDSSGSLAALADGGVPKIDALILCAGQIDYADHQAGVDSARALGVPVLGCSTDYTRSPLQWEAAVGGFSPEGSGGLAMSEMDGIIEPMTVGARVVDAHGAAIQTSIAHQIAWRADRALAWARLRRLPNAQKRLVIAYYSEDGGKADIGSDPDAYLNAQSSIVALLKRLKAEGYDVGKAPIPNAEVLSRRMAEDGSNVGTWNPQELRKRIRGGSVALIPLADYLAWYNALPASARATTEARWGPPPGKLMTSVDEDGRPVIVIPLLRFGNIALVPHPSWGYQQDKGALASLDALPPHHQYIAFYLWMQHVWKADAYLPMFTQLSLMPGKQEGPSSTDWVGLLIGNLPHIQPVPLQANGGIGDRRRTQALTIGFMPELAQATLSPELATLKQALGQADKSGDVQQQSSVRQQAAKWIRDPGIDLLTVPWPTLVKRIGDSMTKTGQAIAPVGTHTLGIAPNASDTARIVQAMLAGDGSTSVDTVTVARILAGKLDGTDAGTRAHVTDYAARVRAAPRELDAIVAALEGRYIEPGPMQDAVRNPDALPGGRDPYTLDTRTMPTREAWTLGVKLADQLIAQYQRDHAAPLRKAAFVLWSIDAVQSKGVTEAEILHLLGTQPVWNARDQVVDVVLDDRKELGRPRVDVLVTTSGTYRDHFRDKIDLIDKAVRLAAGSSEADNAVRAATLRIAGRLKEGGATTEQADERATLRVFSTAIGAYSPSTQFAMKDGADWSDKKIAALYNGRMAHAYGKGADGTSDSGLFAANIDGVEAAVFSQSSNAYGLLDTPMPAAYMGGLTMSVREQSGRKIGTYVNDLKQPGHAEMDSLASTYGRELRSRYFNPAWIASMQKSGYNGARYMADLADDMMLWDVTSPDLVTESDWNELKEVYVDDRYHLGLDKYFDQANPYAQQQMLQTMLQAVARGSWHPSPAVVGQLRKRLEASVAVHGASCGPPSCLTPGSSPGGKATATATSAASRVSGAPAVVTGYAMEAKTTSSSSPNNTQSFVGQLLLALLALLLGTGGFLRSRW